MRLLLLCLLSLCSDATAQEPQPIQIAFPYQANRLGFADALGRLSVWLSDRSLGVPLLEGDKLPLRFQYCSRQERIRDGILGEGWWVPLLESSVVEESESHLRLTTIGGQSLFLRRNPKVLNEYNSGNMRWKGVLENSERFVVSTNDGWKFIYVRGLLDRVVLPSGSQIAWVRSKGRISKIVQSGTTLLEVFYDERGLLTKMRDRLGAELVFQHTEYPRIANIHGRQVILAVVKSCGEISVKPTGRPPMTLNVTHWYDGTDFITRINNKNGDPRLDFESSVHPESGQLLRVGEDAYSVIRDAAGKSIGVSRQLSSGGIESYEFDPKTLTVKRRSSDGRVEIKRYIGTPGLAYMKVQSWEERIGDNLRSGRLRYDSAGRLLREITEARQDGVADKVIRQELHYSDEKFEVGGVPAPNIPIGAAVPVDELQRRVDPKLLQLIQNSLK